MKSVKGLEIGDILYTGSSYLTMAYKVIEVRQTEDSLLYVVECQNCKDHEPCKILIAPKERNNDRWFVYVEMLNNYDDEYCEDQSYYHSGEKFFRTKYEGVIERIKKDIRYCEEELEKHQKKIKYYEKQIEKQKETLETLENKNA